MQPDKILIPFKFNFLLTRNKLFIFIILNIKRKTLRSQTSRSLTRKSWRQFLTSSVENLSWYRHYFGAHPHCSMMSRSKIWNGRDTCHYHEIDVNLANISAPADTQSTLDAASTGQGTLAAVTAALDNPHRVHIIVVTWPTCIRHHVDSETRVIVARARPVNSHAVTVFIAGAVITSKARDPWIRNKNFRLIHLYSQWCQALKWKASWAICFEVQE